MRSLIDPSLGTLEPVSNQANPTSQPGETPSANSTSSTDRHESADFDATLNKTFGRWQLDPGIIYLDHGAFGACPVPVSERQNEVRQQVEADPHGFFERSYLSSWKDSKEALAKFLNADPQGLVLLPGATHALNVVIQSRTFSPGDEVLTTNHAYSSVLMALESMAKRHGAKLVTVDIPLTCSGPSEVLERILSHVTSRTRFAVIDHIPGRSGMVFPIKEIVSELDSRNVDTLVDGAHAPGMIPLNLGDIQAAYYAANCHKWMCSPRGAGFLYVREDRIRSLKPLIIVQSPYKGDGSKYSNLEHDFTWLGTADPSATLSLPSSIRFLNTTVPGGYGALTRRNRDLAITARRVVCEALGIPVPYPDEMIASMAIIPLPDSTGPEPEGVPRIQHILREKHGITVPVYSWPAYPKRVMRLSVHTYNTLQQYVVLADCLRKALHDETNVSPGRSSHEHIKLLPEPLNISIETNSQRLEPPQVNSIPSNSNRLPLELISPHRDVEIPSKSTLLELAQLRARRIATGCFSSYPVALYPTAGKPELEFARNGGTTAGHANLEISRVTYMLSCVEKRRIPQVMVPLIAELLTHDDVILNWPETVRKLKTRAKTLARIIISQMKASNTPECFPTDSRDFVSNFASYETESGVENFGLQLWRRALSDFVRRGLVWCPTRVERFLQIHAFLKDPIGGLRKDFRSQTDLFISIIGAVEAGAYDMPSPVSTKIQEELSAQLASESSFLAHVQSQNVAYVHFPLAQDQQLVYVYLDIDALARSELASAPRVVEMMSEILESDTSCHYIAPITVTRGYPICSSDGGRFIVLDGSNRIATIVLLRFLSLHGVSGEGWVEDLRSYCDEHGLGPTSFVELCAMLRLLKRSHPDILEQQLRDPEKLAFFRDVRQVPVLVTEESSFLTWARIGNKEEVLQPVHQCIFATDDLLVALPSKIQYHGRPKGFRVLPVR